MIRTVQEIEAEMNRLLKESADVVSSTYSPVSVRYYVLDCQRLVRELWQLAEKRAETPR